MKKPFAAQDIFCQIGSLQSTAAFEQALYQGKFEPDVPCSDAMTISLNTKFQQGEDESLWLVDTAFHECIVEGNPLGNVQVVADSSHWLVDAFQYAGCQDLRVFHLAAADVHGVIVITFEKNAREGRWGWVETLDLGQRNRAAYAAQQACGLLETLQPGLPDGNLAAPLLACAVDRNPYGSQTAFTELMQLTRTLLSVRYRTHYQMIHPATTTAGATGGRQYTQSVPWFLEQAGHPREALLMNGRLPKQDDVIHVVEAETQGEIVVNHGCEDPQLFIISYNSEEELSREIRSIRGLLKDRRSLSEVKTTLHKPSTQDDEFRLVLIASTAEDLEKECAAAEKGVPSAQANGKEWQSMNGSYFTPTPLGPDAAIALVYPGAFNSYVGMGRELLHHFPGLQDWFNRLSAKPGEFYQAEKIFPPNAGTANEQEKQQMQENLVGSSLSMLFSGTAVAGLYTHLLHQGFGIEAKAALGYSMGETSMLFATGFWTSTDDVKTEIETLPLFHTRLAGPLDAVREHWLAQGETVPEGEAPIWDNYILMTTFEKALPVVSAEPQVYLTHINAPRQIIIGGEPAGCRRVLEALKCMSFPIPYHYPMHCAAIISEYDRLRDLHMQPIERESGLTYYSSFESAPMIMGSSQIADAIAGGLCNRVDFPALVRSAYADGCRIFIEVGARSNCSKWIENTLKGEAFSALSINQAEVPDLMGVLRVLARLISHGKSVDLRPLDGVAQQFKEFSLENTISSFLQMV